MWPRVERRGQERTRAGDSSVSVLVGDVFSDCFVGVGNWRRDHIRATGPLAEINQAAAVAAKRKVCVRGLRRLLADRTPELDGALARHIWRPVDGPDCYTSGTRSLKTPSDSEDAAKNIPRRMRNDARPQAPAPNCKQAIQSPKAGDLQAQFDPLIAVRNPEEHSLQ